MDNYYLMQIIVINISKNYNIQLNYYKLDLNLLFNADFIIYHLMRKLNSIVSCFISTSTSKSYIYIYLTLRSILNLYIYILYIIKFV